MKAYEISVFASSEQPYGYLLENSVQRIRIELMEGIGTIAFDEKEKDFFERFVEERILECDVDFQKFIKIEWDEVELEEE